MLRPFKSQDLARVRFGILGNSTPEEFCKNIEALQPQGTHFTLPIYYVVKEKLLEPRFRDELCQIIQELANNLYPEFTQDWINLPEDNELLMLQLKD